MRVSWTGFVPLLQMLNRLGVGSSSAWACGFTLYPKPYTLLRMYDKPETPNLESPQHRCTLHPRGRKALTPFNPEAKFSLQRAPLNPKP